MTPSKPSQTVNVSAADFDREVMEASKERPVVVDFWAPWCGPCRALAPILEKVIADQQGAVVLAKVNIDEAPELANRFQVQGIPLVIAFRQGQPVAEFDGARPETFVRQFIQQILPNETEKLLAEARRLETADLTQAEKLYRQALDGDPRSEPAAIGLARALLERGQETEALRWLEEAAATEETDRLRARAALGQLARQFAPVDQLRQRVAAEPKNATALYELGCALAAAAKHAEALALLLSAAEHDPKLAASAVREAMVKVFLIVGLHSELANDYRDRLSTLLY
jgi:putative thioredoxin